MSFYFRDEVLPYYGGGTAEARSEVAGNDYMYWELMRRSCETRAYARYSISVLPQQAAAPVPSTSRKNWGFEPQQLHLRISIVSGKIDTGHESSESEISIVDQDVAASAAFCGEYRNWPACREEFGHKEWNIFSSSPIAIPVSAQ